MCSTSLVSQIIRTCQQRAHFGRNGELLNSMRTICAHEYQAPHLYAKHSTLWTSGIQAQAVVVPKANHLKHIKAVATADNTTKLMCSLVFLSIWIRSPGN